MGKGADLIVEHRTLRLEKHVSKAHGTVYEIMPGNSGYRLSLFKIQFRDLRELLDKTEALEASEKLALGERRRA